MKKLFTVLAIVVGMVACTNNPTTPTGGFDGTVLPGTDSDRPSSASVSRPGISSGELVQTECEIIGITARRVLYVSFTSVTLRVVSTFTEGVRVRIIDVRTGYHIGDYDLGDITLSNLTPGDYHWYIFVEVPKYPGGLIQCDGSVRFTIPTRPTPPPTCVGEECNPVPPCEEDSLSTDDECEPEPEGACFYNVAGSDGKELCFNEPGFVSWNEKNHLCELTFPGVARKGWNLNPGQSVEGCLRKQDDE